MAVNRRVAGVPYPKFCVSPTCAACSHQHLSEMSSMFSQPITSLPSADFILA